MALSPMELAFSPTCSVVDFWESGVSFSWACDVRSLRLRGMSIVALRKSRQHLQCKLCNTIHNLPCVRHDWNVLFGWFRFVESSMIVGRWIKRILEWSCVVFIDESRGKSRRWGILYAPLPVSKEFNTSHMSFHRSQIHHLMTSWRSPLSRPGVYFLAQCYCLGISHYWSNLINFSLGTYAGLFQKFAGSSKSWSTINQVRHSNGFRRRVTAWQIHFHASLVDLVMTISIICR